MKLAFVSSALALSSVAAHAAPLPYVHIPITPPSPAGWMTSSRSLDVEDRRVAFAFQKSYCNEDYSVCSNETSIQVFDGVSTRVLETSENFLQFVELSSTLAVWEVPNDGYQQFLRKLKPNGDIVTVSNRALYDSWAVDGNDVAYQIVNTDTGRWDIVLNNKTITANRPSGGNGPQLESGNVLYSNGDGGYTLYDGAADKHRALPKFADDQLPAGVRLSPDGKTAVWLARDFFMDEVEHSQLKVYDLDTKQTKTYAHGSPLFDIGFDGRYYVWARSTSAGIEGVVTDIGCGVHTDNIDAELSGDAGYWTAGTVSHGQLSFVQGTGDVKLYDLGDGDITDVAATGYAIEVANWRKNVVYSYYGPDSNVALTVAYPADQAVIAISEVIDTYNLAGNVEGPLQDKLDAALDKLDDGKLGQAKSKLQAFNTTVAQLKNHGLSAARAAALTTAANRVIAVL